MIYEKLPKDIASLTSQAPQGIHRLCKKHPMVKIVTSEIDASRVKVSTGLSRLSKTRKGSITTFKRSGQVAAHLEKAARLARKKY